MTQIQRLQLAAAACLALVLAMPLGAAAQKDEKGHDEKARLTLRANPMVSVSPSRVVLTGELLGGSDESDEFYCPTVEWEWGDGTKSEASTDCQPFEPGKSEIKRRYTVEHVFRAGNHKVALRLKRRDKIVAFATLQLQVRPGLNGGL